MISVISAHRLISLLVGTGIVSASAIRPLDNRDVVCSGDNLLNKFWHTASSAIPFCQTYIGAYAYQTVTVTTNYDATTTATPIVAASPGPWLPQTFPPARLSSACSCLSVPTLTDATVTVFVKQTSTLAVTTSSSTAPLTTSITASVTSNLVSSTLSSTATATSAPFSSFGCWAEPDHPARALSVYLSTPDMTQDSCFAFCGTQGYAYAGLEYASDCRQECWCGNTLGGGTAVDSSQCNATCTPKVDGSCRGSRNLQLYSAVGSTSTTISLSASSTATVSTTSTSSVPVSCNAHQPAPTPVRNEPILDLSSEMVLVDWRNGSDPAPTRTKSSFAGSSSDLPDYCGPASPGYGGAQYSYLIDFTAGDATFGYYNGGAWNVEVPDPSAQYVAKMRYKSARSDQCYIRFRAGPTEVLETVTGCDSQWTELVSDPITGDDTAYYGISIGCFYLTEGETSATAKFWLDNLRLYRVI